MSDGNEATETEPIPSSYDPDFATWIEALVEALGPEEAGEWLTLPNDHLAGRTPLEAIEDGDQKKVAAHVVAIY